MSVYEKKYYLTNYYMMGEKALALGSSIHLLLLPVAFASSLVAFAYNFGLHLR